MNGAELMCCACLCLRCWTLLWQHWGHDWVQTSITDQVLLALCYPCYLQCECLKRACTHYIYMNNLSFWSHSVYILMVCFLLKGTLVFLLLKYTPLRFNNSYVYPWWAYWIGWFLAMSSLTMIPVTMICKLAKGKGTLWQVSGIANESLVIIIFKKLLVIFIN